MDDGKTIVVSPHKVDGPQTNDLTLQRRKRGISKVVVEECPRNLVWRRFCAN